jgi:serine/threonine-protein kinase
MPATEKPSPDEGVPSDLLSVIRRSGVLAERQFEEVRTGVKSGAYPSEPHALAERLVQEEILTRFQANRLLQNKAHGLVIDRYVLLERLGEGSMGRVFKAQHRLMGRLVALKLIAPHYATRAKSIARFRRELRMIGRLDHPHIVRAYDAAQFGESFYLAMEYARGQTLDRVYQSRGGPLTPEEVIDYAAQAALGLAHAHAQGILHRDIKPSNLLLTDDRQIKVLDLGLGTLIDPEEQTSFATAAGRAVGTIDFMSPEQASGDDLDGRSDCFGLGCTMYILMCGRLPFPADTDLKRLVRRLEGPPVPITNYLPDLPAAVVEVLDKLLARDPRDRFPTATDAAAALRALLQDGGFAPPAGPPSPAATPPDPIRLSSTSAASAEAPSDPPDWHVSSAPSMESLANSTSGHSVIDVADRSPRFGLATLLLTALAAFFVGLILGRM